MSDEEPVICALHQRERCDQCCDCGRGLRKQYGGDPPQWCDDCNTE